IMPGGASSTALPIATATMPYIGGNVYAGFWIRAIAFLIDSIILAIPAGGIHVGIGSRLDNPAGHAVLTLTIVTLMALTYFAWLWSSPVQATLGQRFCALRVLDAITRGRISFLRGLGRG